MPLAVTAYEASFGLALIVLLALAFLGWWQWRERQKRDDRLSEADARHFARQDVRRLIGSVLLALVAVGVVAGTSIPLGGHPSRLIRRTFAGVWLLVILLLAAALVLAWIDIKATRVYARRHSQAIDAERRAFLEQARRRRRAFPTNGRGGPPDSVSSS